MNVVAPKPPVVPFSLKDAPSLIERVWPAQKISVEAQKERKAGSGQTLTALGSYWKGRKPLILVRACVLAALLPSTGDDEKDIEIFEILCGISDEQVSARFKEALSADEVVSYGSHAQQEALLEWRDAKPVLKKIPKELRRQFMSSVLQQMPYQKRVEKLYRPEEIAELNLTEWALQKVNSHLRTSANSLPELIKQLGIMRFGHSPIVGDTFCGGGSIPFEAARLGCSAVASDLNPIACMLTWGALNIVGGSDEKHSEIDAKLQDVVSYVENSIAKLGIETDASGNRAKAYLYCLEARCPQTGWLVPLAPSWIISKTRNVIAVLIPDHANKKYNIEIRTGATAAQLADAQKGTMQDGNMVHSYGNEIWRTPIKTIRGDRKTENGESKNNLRLWSKEDIVPAKNDIFQERLYCIQWSRTEGGSGRDKTFFASVTDDDLARERKVTSYVHKKLQQWQDDGLTPDMQIETGKENEGPISPSYSRQLCFEAGGRGAMR
jgi:hypothetical protein